MEIGIDIEQNSRFVNKSKKFFEELFLPEEIFYANKHAKSYEHYCAFWCVKEAVIKAFGNITFDAHDICIMHDESGKPYVKLNEKFKMLLKEKNLSEIKISISHTKDYTTAICLLC